MPQCPSTKPYHFRAAQHGFRQFARSRQDFTARSYIRVRCSMLLTLSKKIGGFQPHFGNQANCVVLEKRCNGGAACAPLQPSHFKCLLVVLAFSAALNPVPLFDFVVFCYVMLAIFFFTRCSFYFTSLKKEKVVSKDHYNTKSFDMDNENEYKAVVGRCMNP